MMVDIQKIGEEIVERLKPLKPEKIILFGSYAYGKPTEESDIDLFLVKSTDELQARELRLEAKKRMRDLISKYGVGFDILVASKEFLTHRKDYFYRVEIMQKGKVLYE